MQSLYKWKMNSSGYKVSALCNNKQWETIAIVTAWFLRILSVSFCITKKIEMIKDWVLESHVKSHFLMLLVCQKEKAI